MHPPLPGRSNVVWLWEPLSIVSEFNESTLVLVLVVEVLVVSVAVLVCADQSGKLISKTCLLVRGSVWLTSEDGSHESLLAVELPELRAHHSDGHTP